MTVILPLDIETAPQHWEEFPEYRVCPPPIAMLRAVEQIAGTNPPASYGPEARRAWYLRKLGPDGADALDRAVKWWRDCSTDPKYGRVVCAAIAGSLTEGDPPVVIWEDTEIRTLEAIADYIRSRGFGILLAWRGRVFDFPFLWERAMLYRRPDIAVLFSTMAYAQQRALFLKARAWRPIDLLDCYQTVRGSSDRMADVLQAMGLHYPDPMTGADVLDRLCAGDTDAVRHHVTTDVVKLQAIARIVLPANGVEW